MREIDKCALVRIHIGVELPKIVDEGSITIIDPSRTPGRAVSIGRAEIDYLIEDLTKARDELDRIVRARNKGTT